MTKSKFWIARQLYKRYYGEKNPSEPETSSHWKEYHKKTKVDFSDGYIRSLSGHGFGYVQSESFISQMFTGLTIASYFFCAEDKRKLFNLIKIAFGLSKKMELVFSYDFYRQICSLNLIMKKMDFSMNERIRVINIGDGCGVLSALIKEIFPNSLICLVDLGKTLLFQAYYCNRAHPSSQHHLVSDGDGNIPKQERGDFIYCPAENLDALSGLPFDLAINIASMQEMKDLSINRYFDFLRRNMVKNNLFYCCNREEKEMPDGKTTRFLSYPWLPEDTHLVDEYCPWHSYFFSFQTTKYGPKTFGLRVPFINYFEGKLRHRLTILHTKRSLI